MIGRSFIPAFLLMLSSTGCVCPHPATPMSHHPSFPARLPVACQTACDRLRLAPTPWLVVVRVSTQTLALYDHGRYARQFPCSTSRLGAGQIEGSNRTPLGLHAIAEKIGADAPPGTVFNGHTSDPGLADAKITTRILWLEGLDPGYNQGGNVDSHARYIYIHGTADQTGIGAPASCGCIHLADPDLITLFELLPAGTMVWIEE